MTSSRKHRSPRHRGRARRYAVAHESPGLYTVVARSQTISSRTPTTRSTSSLDGRGTLEIDGARFPVAEGQAVVVPQAQTIASSPTRT
jgi:hypothetical protein